jgi:hypothetical protein
MSGGGGDFGSFVYAVKNLNCSGTSGYKVWRDGTNGHTMTELAQKWVEGGGFENDGIVLKTSTADESTASLLSFYSGDTDTAHAPVLEVTSERPSGLEGGGFQNTIAVNPTDPNIVVSGGDVAGVHLSRDGGVTWTSQNTGMPDQQHLKVASLAWSDATTVFALAGNGNKGGLMRGVVETNEANVVNGVWIHWTELTGTPAGLLGNGGDPYPTSGTGLPDDPNLPKLKAPLAAADTAIANPKANEHPRSVGRLLVVDTGRNRMYVGTYNAGVYRAKLSTITTDPQWAYLGLNGEYVRSIDLDASQNALFASTYRGPIGSSAASDGKVWRVSNASTAALNSAVELTGSPVNVEELRLLNGTLYGVMDARDGPTTYTEFGQIWIDPSVDAGYQRGLFRLPSAWNAGVGTTWSQITHTVTVGGTQVTRPDVSTGTDPCTSNQQRNQIWYSLDGYASGSNVTLWVGARNPACEAAGGQRIALTRLSTTDGWQTVASSDADPQSAPTTMILGTTNRQWWIGVARPAFMLGAGTFTSSDVAVAPGATSTIYTAGRSGVWKSSDGGATWAPAVRSMSVTINRQLLNDPTSANNVDIGNVDFDYITSMDRMQTVTQQEISDTATAGYALARDPVSNALIVGVGARDTDTDGEVRWKNPSTGIWTPIALPPGVTQRPIGLLAIKDVSGARSVLAAVDEQGMYQSKFNTSTGCYDDFAKLTTPSMLQDASLKRASFIQGAAGSNNVYLYDKTQGVFRGAWTYGGGNWSWTWTRILNYPSMGSPSSPAAGDGSGYVAPHPTNPDILYVTSGGDATHSPKVYKITNATTAGQDGAQTTELASGLITDPGPIDVDPDGVVDSDNWASIVITEPATSAHPVRLWSVNPNSAGDPSKWNLRELDGLTAQPLIPLDLDYDPRDGNVYIATFGIGVYTAYLPMPGPA